METLKAELMPWRQKPLHPGYSAIAQAHANRIIRNGGSGRPAYETTCPYCGVDSGVLFGRIRLGGKDHMMRVELTRHGYSVPDGRDRAVDIQLVECPDCGAKLSPLAYTSPAVFYEERAKVILLPLGDDHGRAEMGYAALVAAQPANQSLRMMQRTSRTAQTTHTATLPASTATSVASTSGHVTTERGHTTHHHQRGMTDVRKATTRPNAPHAQERTLAAEPAQRDVSNRSQNTHLGDTMSGARSHDVTPSAPSDIVDRMDQHPPFVATGDEIRAVPAETMHLQIQYLPRTLVDPDPEQPRVEMTAGDLAELRETIQQRGIGAPIVVRQHPAVPGRYMLINGERRWAASAGVQEMLPCIIRGDMENEVDRLLAQLDANLGVPLTTLEEARAYVRLMTLTGQSQNQIARFRGVPRSTINDRVRLLELGAWVPLIEDGTINVAQAVENLLAVRRVPNTYHEAAIRALLNAPRWVAARGDLSSAAFGEIVDEIYGQYMYPLAVVHGIGRQPEFDTSDHATACTCGGIRWADAPDEERRSYCGNPDYWMPRRREARRLSLAQTTPDAPSARQTSQTALVHEGRPLLVANTTPCISPRTAVAEDVILLSDATGKWAVSASPSMRGDTGTEFDPADLTIDPAALVRVSRRQSWDTYECVGTRDQQAVAVARRQWADRWRARYHAMVGDLTATLDAIPSEDRIVGGPAILTGVLRLAATAAAPRVRDLLHALGLGQGVKARRASQLADQATESAAGSLDRVETTNAVFESPDAVVDLQRLIDDVAALSPADQCILLTAIGVIAHGDAQTPQEIVRTEMEAARKAMSQRPVPWIPKDSEHRASA